MLPLLSGEKGVVVLDGVPTSFMSVRKAHGVILVPLRRRTSQKSGGDGLCEDDIFGGGSSKSISTKNVPFEVRVAMVRGAG